jgi:hypothetical protein
MNSSPSLSNSRKHFCKNFLPKYLSRNGCEEKEEGEGGDSIVRLEGSTDSLEGGGGGMQEERKV